MSTTGEPTAAERAALETVAAHGDGGNGGETAERTTDAPASDGLVEMTYRDAMRSALHEALSTDHRVVVKPRPLLRGQVQEELPRRDAGPLRERLLDPRVANVVSRDHDYGMTRMLELTSQGELPHEFSVFRDMDEACEWLEVDRAAVLWPES